MYAYVYNCIYIYRYIYIYIPTCENQMCRLYGAASLGYQTTSTLTKYFTESHYPGTELTSPCSILVMSNAGLVRDK